MKWRLWIGGPGYPKTWESVIINDAHNERDAILKYYQNVFHKPRATNYPASWKLWTVQRIEPVSDTI